jgi:hypothetical protein
MGVLKNRVVPAVKGQRTDGIALFVGDFTAFDETSVPSSGVLPRSGQSAVTLPGDKKILISGGVASLGVVMRLVPPKRLREGGCTNCAPSKCFFPAGLV